MNPGRRIKGPRRSGRGMYELAVVTFLDILGFRELVAGSPPEEVDRKLQALERFTKPQEDVGDDIAAEMEPKALQFSDTIVRVRRVETAANLRYPVGLVFHELLDLLHAQAELIQERVLLRGGVSIGQIRMSGARLFGPGLISAYDLESRYAIYPRIVVAPALIGELKSNRLLRALHHAVEDEAESVRNLLSLADDGLWYVDYVRAIPSELDEPSMYLDFLSMHRDLIISGARESRPGTSKMSKYVWLAHYHNAAIHGLSGGWLEQYGARRDDLLISSDDVSDLQYLPAV